MWQRSVYVVVVVLVLMQAACSTEEGEAPEEPLEKAPVVVADQKPLKADPIPEPREEVPTVETKPIAFEEEDEPEVRRAPARQERERERRPKRVTARSDADLEVVSAMLATNVVNRKPEGRSTRFGSDVGQVWAWVKVRNNGSDAAPITMVWRHKGKVRSTTDLNIGVSKGWRTWTRKTINPKHTGSWSVEVRDPSGKTLKTLSFHVDAEVTSIDRSGTPPRILQR